MMVFSQAQRSASFFTAALTRTCATCASGFVKDLLNFPGTLQENSHGNASANPFDAGEPESLTLPATEDATATLLDGDDISPTESNINSSSRPVLIAVWSLQSIGWSSFGSGSLCVTACALLPLLDEDVMLLNSSKSVGVLARRQCGHDQEVEQVAQTTISFA
jgi:hypothetical protein